MKEATLVLEESYIDPYIIANSNPDEALPENTKKEDSLNIKNIGQRFINAIQSVTSNETNTSSQTSSQENIKQENIKLNSESINNENVKKVFIIVGSFSNIENAQALTKQLKKRGFPNAEIIGKNESGLIRVSVDSFFTEEEAHLVLKNTKNSIASAWVLNTN